MSSYTPFTSTGMADTLIKDMMAVTDMRTQLKDYVASTDKTPQARDWCERLDIGLTYIQQAQSLKITKLCDQIPVDNNKVENIAYDGMSHIMETVFECYPKLSELNDSDAKECNTFCSWFLQNIDCIKNRVIET